MIRNLISTSIVTLLAGAVTSLPAFAKVAIPDCGAIVNWAAKAEGIDNIRSLGGVNAARQYRSGNALLSGFKDEHWVPVFGAPFPEATSDELIKLSEKAESCRLAIRGQIRQLGPRDPRRTTIGHADSYLMFMFHGGPRNTRVKATILQEMARQKANYRTYNEAAVVRDAQLGEMRKMQPSLENIAKLEEMTKERGLAGLGAEYRPHLTALQQHQVQLADLMLTTASAEFYKFPKTLAGLRDMVAFRARTFADLGKLKSRNWKGFSNTYATKLNELAQSALPEFVEELKAIPVSAEGKEKVRGSVAALFPQQPLPRNVPDYHAAVSKRVAEIEAELEVIACNKTLTKHGLAKDAATPLLGSDGQSTLGTFVCALPDGGHEFSSYKKPGMFGSTHTLTVLAPKGTSITVEMKSVEAVQGKPKMLVGTRVKDATTANDLTLAQWQAMAGTLTGVGSGPPKRKLITLTQSAMETQPAGCVRTIYVQSVTSFPVTVEADRLSVSTIQQFEALRKLGLFEVSITRRPPPPRGTGMNAHTYTLTEMGKPYFKGRNGLCFAKMKVEDVANVSEPIERGGRKVVTAVAKYSASLPEFALDPQFAAGVKNGEMQRLINAVKSGQVLQSKIAFIETDSGWQVAK